MGDAPNRPSDAPAAPPAGPFRLTAAVVVGSGAAIARSGLDSPRSLVISATLALVAAAIVWIGWSRPGRAWTPADAVLGIGGLGAVAAAVAMGFVYPLAVTAAGTALAFGALIRWSIPPSWPQRTQPVAGLALGPLIVAMLLWYRSPSPATFAALAALSVALLELYARSHATTAHITTFFDRLGRAVSWAITRTVAAVVMVVVIIPVNLVSRLFGYSPLDPGWADESTAWLAVDDRRFRRPDGTVADPDRMVALEPTPSPSVRRRGWLRSATLVAAVAAVVFAFTGLPGGSSDGPTSGSTGSAPDSFTRPFEDDAAFEGAPWAADLRLDLLDAWQNLEFNAALGGWSIRDVSSTYINVEDGRRVTVAPDPSLGEPITVWLLGGSAAFGAGQRDEHTIASELVDLAGDAGIPLEIHNLAVPATVNWQEAMVLIGRLRWAEAPPDLVVVYDGANDLILQDVLAAQGKGGSDEPASLIDGELDQILREQAASRSDGVSIEADETPDPDPTPSPEEAGELVLSRYGQGVDQMAQTLATESIPLEVFWQPELQLKQPLSEADRATLDELGVTDDSIRTRQATAAVVRAGLGDLGVTDLSTVFDGRSDAVYWDTVHTNELGARLVAEAMWDRLEPTLQELEAQR